MKQVLINLIQVQKSLKNGTYKTDKAILTVLINEAIEELQNTTFQLEVFYCKENWKSHFVSYSNLQKKYKATLICDLQVLRNEINKKKVNELLCLVMVQEMIESNLYTNYVKAVVEKWQTKNSVLKSKIIEV